MRILMLETLNQEYTPAHAQMRGGNIQAINIAYYVKQCKYYELSTLYKSKPLSRAVQC